MVRQPKTAVFLQKSPKPPRRQGVNGRVDKPAKSVAVCNTRQEHSTLQLNAPALGWLFTVSRVVAPAPRPEPASRLRSVTCDVTFL